MLLIIQIALGIVLGFLLIQYHQQIGRGLRMTLLFLVAITAVVFFGWVGSEITTSLSESGLWVRAWNALASMILPLLCLAIVAFAGLGFQFLIEMKWPTRTDKARDDSSWPILLYGFANALLTTLAYYGLAAFTPLGNVGDFIDSYGRANGWADGLTVLSFSLATLWPWLVLLLIRKFTKIPALPKSRK